MGYKNLCGFESHRFRQFKECMMKLAETKEDWSRVAASMIPSLRRFPDFISKDLITVVPIVPEGCMEVWEGKDDRCERGLEKMARLRKEAGR